MKNNRTTAALELALQLLTAVETGDYLPVDSELPGTLISIRDSLEGALASIRQQPVQFDDAELYLRLRAEVAAAGSETALAKKIDIARQSLSDVLNSRREPGPKILDYLRVKRVKTVRYEHAEPVPKPEPKPRSERRQRAWDMQPRITQEGASA